MHHGGIEQRHLRNRNRLDDICRTGAQGRRPCRAVGHKADVNACGLRFVAPVIGIAIERGAAGAINAFQHKGSAAGVKRIDDPFLTVGRARQDRQLRAGEPLRQQRIRRCGGNDHRVITVGAHLQIHAVQNAWLWRIRRGGTQRVDDCRRIQRRAIMKTHPLTQRQPPGMVLKRFPSRCQPRLRIARRIKYDQGFRRTPA